MLTVAVTGPTGEVGKPFVAALERMPEVGRVIGMARRRFDPAKHRLGEGRVPPGRHPAIASPSRAGRRRRCRRPPRLRHRRRRRRRAAEINRAAPATSSRRRSTPASSGSSTPRRSPPTAFTATSRAAHRGHARPRHGAPPLLGREGGGRGRAGRGAARAPETDAYVFRPCIVAGPEATLLLDMIPLLALGQRMPGPLAGPSARSVAAAGAARLRRPLPARPPRRRRRRACAAAIGIGKPGVYNLAGPGELTITDLAHELGWHAIVPPPASSPSELPPRRSPTSRSCPRRRPGSRRCGGRC